MMVYLKSVVDITGTTIKRRSVYAHLCGSHRAGRAELKHSRVSTHYTGFVYSNIDTNASNLTLYICKTV